MDRVDAHALDGLSGGFLPWTRWFSATAAAKDEAKRDMSMSARARVFEKKKVSRL